MATAGQPYGSPLSMHSSADQPSELDGDRKSRGCPGTIDQKRSRHQYIKPQPQPSSANNYFRRNGASEDLSSLFDFDAPLDAPFTTDLGKKTTLTSEPSFGLSDGWDPLAQQPLSPPDSAIYPDGNWQPFNSHAQPPHNILSYIDPSRARTQYGQTTPPDDERFDGLDSELLMQEQQEDPFYLENPSNAVKHKRPSSGTESSARFSKRIRKSGGRGSKNADLDPNNPEDARRSKFLERNRVAASKCRQKKKEWTNDLETRARVLQKDNTSLRHMVDSCKEEILFLKGEMLKHNACSNLEIQDYLQRSVSAYHGSSDGNIKQEPSPLHTAPTSPASSPPDHAHGSGSRTFLKQSSTRRSVSDHTLERLLTSQFIHDTSEEGIAQRLAR